MTIQNLQSPETECDAEWQANAQQAALAVQSQETPSKPVAWAIKLRDANESTDPWDCISCSPDVAQEDADAMESCGIGGKWDVVPLYAAPEAESTPQELYRARIDAYRAEAETLAEIERQRILGINAQEAPSVPVAWRFDFEVYNEDKTISVIRDWLTTDHEEAHDMANGCHNITPLYTRPAPASAQAAVPDITCDVRNTAQREIYEEWAAQSGYQPGDDAMFEAYQFGVSQQIDAAIAMLAATPSPQQSQSEQFCDAPAVAWILQNRHLSDRTMLVDKPTSKDDANWRNIPLYAAPPEVAALQTRITELEAGLRSVNAVSIERGDKYGACDQIDNDGQQYQSQWLADLIAAAPPSTQQGVGE